MDVVVDAAYVADLMTECPVGVSSDGSVIDVARAMVGMGVHHIPLLRDGRPVGMASALDTLSTGARTESTIVTFDPVVV